MRLQNAWIILFLVIILQVFWILQANAGTEYVYVQKTIDDQAIIVRRNGDAYLIEKGVGCLSLWRCEGKIVLIGSPGIFLGVGSQLLIPDLGQKRRIWNSEYLGSAGTSSPPPSGAPKRPPPKTDCTDKHWIQSKSDDGSIVILEDGTVWQVDIVNRVDSMLWLPIQDVIICGGAMINLSNGEKVAVIRLK